MKTLFTLLSVVLLFLVSVAVALAADPAVPAAVTAVIDPSSPTTWIAAILGVLLALSEMLALIPSIKSNGIFDALFKGLKAISGKGSA